MSGITEEQIKASWVAMEPLVTILCPTFNHEQYIGNALDSFLMQSTTFPFEIVVHDDASTDMTAQIVKSYVEKYPNIIRYVIQDENQYSKGRRILEVSLAYARGKYVAFCEGDDYWADPSKIQKQVEFLEANPEYVITYHRSQPFNKAGELCWDYGGATRDLSEDELQKAHPIFTLTTCFRNVVTKFPPEFAGARYGDLFMWSLLGQHGKGKFMPNIQPARYRVHEGGVFSMKDMQKKFEMAFITDAALFAYYSRTGLTVNAKHFKRSALINCVKSIPLVSKVWMMLKVVKEKLVSRNSEGM